MQASIEEIRALSQRALLAHGAGDLQAAEVARAISRAEETGNIICGLYYLESYCIQLASGRVSGTAEPVVIEARPGFISVDAHFGFAQPAFAKGLPVLCEAARSNGIAALGVGHAHTCTSLGYFTEQIAGQGLIGLGFTNASAIVAGPGGKSPILGTNPIAITLPGMGAPRMHADFSTAAVALGKITMAKAAGEPIPLGWAVDAGGSPTTDPEAALNGALISTGGYKGWALGLLVECLAAGLTGSVTSKNINGLKLADGPPHDLGQFYIAIDTSVSEGAFEARIAQVIEAIEQDPNIRMPGSPRKTLDRVEVDDALWAKLDALGSNS